MAETTTERVSKCKLCGQEVKIVPGLHNWKNLMRYPTLDEWITLFLIAGIIAMIYFYVNDIKQYQDYIKKNCRPALVNPPITGNTGIPGKNDGNAYEDFGQLSVIGNGSNG
jgi:hypothetical protein